MRTINGGLSGIKITSEEIPNNFNLYQNYPNPFNPVTKIKFDIPLLAKVYDTVKAYNLTKDDIINIVKDE